VCEVRSTVCSNVATVSFEGAAPAPIQLSATGRSDGTYQYLDLTWSGAQGDSVAVYLNDSLRRTAANKGSTTLRINFQGTATYRLKVCQTGSTTCSNVAIVEFAGG
jgi:hypothetical protein